MSTELDAEIEQMMVDSGVDFKSLNEDQKIAIIEGAATFALATMHDSYFQRLLMEDIDE